MPQWAPFLAVTAVVLAALLVLAHLSQRTIEKFESPERNGRDDTRPGVDTPAVSDAVSDRETAVDDDSTGPDADDTERPETPRTQDPSGTPPGAGQRARTDPLVGGSMDRSGGGRGATERDPIENSAVDPTSSPAPDVGTDQRQSTDQGMKLTARMLMLNVAFTQALVLIVLGVAAWYFTIPSRALGLGFHTVGDSLREVGLGVAFGAVLWFANELSTTLADVAGAAYDEQVRELLAPTTERGWLALFGGVLPLIAVGEELLFRAALVGVPNAAGYGVSVWVLVVGSSVAFALGHGAQGRVGVVVTGVLGFVLATGYVLTGSLLVVVVAHYVINALEFLVHELLNLDSIDPVAVSELG